MPEKLICPHCRSNNRVDACHEKECPGFGAFVPQLWQRPLHEMTQDLERYEALILDADTHFANPKLASNIALRVSREAQAIRAKQKKEAPKERKAPPAPPPEPETLTLS